MKQKKSYTAKQKVEILREHLENQVPVSELCERYHISPNNFYNWKKKLFEGALQTFSTTSQRSDERQIKSLKEKLQDRDSIISEIVRENVRLKKNLNGEI